MKISYFFRKPSPLFHSIEELFFNIQKELPKEVEYNNIFAKYHKGFFKRLLVAFQAINKQSEINHITGDIHFISFFLKKSKTILTVHDVDSILKGNNIKRFIFKMFWFVIPFKRVNYITVVSEFTKQQILEKFKINPNKIVVIPNCISPKLKFYPKKIDKNNPTILQIGAHKNLERNIEALQGIKCTFFILGNVTSEQKKLLKEKKIPHEIYFNLDFDEVIELYKKTDILLFSSLYEGFGVPIVEANAIGTCVITSDLSPMKEVAGDAAILVNPYKVEEIKNAILQLINDDELRESLIQKGLRNKERFTGKKIAEEYYSLYQKVLNSFQ